MGNFESESDVEIIDEHGNFVTSPEERGRYKTEGRYICTPFYNLFRGKYNALANNCIHFTRHFVFEQILNRKKELKDYGSNVQWVMTKWWEMGCSREPVELSKFLSQIYGLNNPFAVGPEKGAKLGSILLTSSSDRYLIIHTQCLAYSALNSAVSFSTLNTTPSLTITLSTILPTQTKLWMSLMLPRKTSLTSKRR
jgi:hypothetical protein